MHAQAPKIKLLPIELTNQIAAGEVVERPASVVKELIENALDAKATQISVTIENGGQSLICVEDNGIGIASAELELAVTRHATSKLQDIAGLSQISSYGFRGEALPSIASVSKFRVVSKSMNEAEGSELNVEFGKVQNLSPSTLRQGTLIEVKDLFFNIPARLKFLKNPSTELKRATDLFIRLALIAENITLSLYAGTRLSHRFEAHENLKERLEHIWPPAVVEALLPISHEAHGIKVTGFISHPRSHQPRADRMLFYVNERAVSDKLLMRAVRQAFHGKITTRDYPQCVLCIEISAQEIDVNVHPAKNEVRFRDEQALFSAVMHSVSNALENSPHSFSAKQLLEQNDSNASIPHGEGIYGTQSARLGDLHIPKPQGFWGDADKETSLAFIKENAEKKLESTGTKSIKDNRPTDWSIEHTHYPPSAQVYSKKGLQEPYEKTLPLSSNYNYSEQEKHPKHTLEFSPEHIHANYAEKASTSLPGGLVYLGQIAKTYLVLRKSSDALILLDQHAAHERILYEQVRKGQILSQNLLVPIEFPLHPSEQSRIEEILPQLQNLAFEISLSNQCCAVSAIPTTLSRVEATAFLKDILTEKADDLERIWIHHACSSAIKANLDLDIPAALNLITQWLNTDEPDYCPHGRPCVLHFDASKLEQMFKRRI